MCTLTIIPTPTSMIITMNRDERRERHEPGVLVERDGLVYPLDSVSGGTWIGVNSEQGVVLAILNRYQAPHQAGLSSRGEIIPEALVQPSPVLWLSQMDPSQYNPFDLFCVSKSQLWHFQWNGSEGLQLPGSGSIAADNSGYVMQELGIGKGFMFTSSSLRTDEVLAYRGDLFRNWLIGAAVFNTDDSLASAILNDFHRRQDAGCAEMAVLMEREFSHTKSIVQVVVGEQGAHLDYYQVE